MKPERLGMDALSHLTDVLFETTNGPIPSFVPKGTKVGPSTEETPSTDIVEARPSWQPAR
jgi:hypothetical protein